MRFTAEQSRRWMELHKRKAEVALARSQHTGADNEAAAFAAEMEKINGQIDALLRECMDDDSYREYRRSLSKS